MIYIIEVGLTFVMGCLFSMLVLPRISLVSFKLRLFDQVNARKIHKARIPCLGGIAFFPCITVVVSLAVVFHNLYVDGNLLTTELTNQILTLFSALFMIYLMGMMDDLIGMRYRSKFVIQIFCGSLLVISGLCFDNLFGLFGIYEIPSYIGIPFTVFIIVYILNAINLIDGIDGLASGVSIMAFLAFGCMFIFLGWWVYAFISFAAFGVLIPFFYYNVFGNVHRGRKIFMGDTGSLTIGMLLSVLAIRLSMSDPVKDSTYSNVIVIVFSFLLVPMLDVARVMIHRLRNGKSPFIPDKNHIHHKFIALGMSQHQAMLCIMSIILIFVVINICLIRNLSATVLLLLDVAVWTVMHCLITRKIRNRSRIDNIKKYI